MQTDIDDDQLAKAIAAKLGDTPGISYTEIASKALDGGRTALAIKVSILNFMCLTVLRFSFIFHDN